LGLVVARVVSGLLNFDGPLAFTFVIVLQTVVPYAVGRMFLADPRALRIASISLIAVAVPIGLIGLREASGSPNPFFTLIPPGYEGGVWAHSLARFDRVRAESSFGHPLALGMFLALVLVLILGMAWGARGWRRVALGGAALMLFFSLLATLSRGPLAVLLGGVLVWFVTHRRLV
jgi:hypothetical protein